MSVVIVRLERLAKKPIHFFSILKCNGKKSYLAISSSSFFIVDSAVRFHQTFYFAWISEIVIDEADTSKFQIFFVGKSPLIVESPARQSILNQIEVYWKTEHMMRTHKVGKFPIRVGAIKGSSAAPSSSFLSSPPGQNEFSAEDYRYFAPDSFQIGTTKVLPKISEDVPNPLHLTDAPIELPEFSSFLLADEFGVSPSETHIYHIPSQSKKSTGSTINSTVTSTSQNQLTIEKFSGSHLISVVFPVQLIADRVAKGRYQLRLTAEAFTRQTIDWLESLNSQNFHASYLIESHEHRKKMNLTNDPSAWVCWRVHTRTPLYDIGLVLLRRSFIPPFGDTLQDMLFIHIGPPNSFFDHFPTLLVCKAADTVFSSNPNYFYDDLVIANRANSLSFDPSSYSWFRTQLVIEPRWSNVSRSFIKCIAHKLELARVPGVEANSLEPKASLIQNHWEIIQDLNLEINHEIQRHITRVRKAWKTTNRDHTLKFSLGPDKTNFLRNQGIIWRSKVSKFFGWAIDGGYHSEINVKKLVYWVMGDPSKANAPPLLTGSTARSIHLLLDYLLYLRNARSDFDPTLTLWERLEDPSILGEDPVVNNNIFTTLLRTNYFRYLILGTISIPPVDPEEPPPMYDTWLDNTIKFDDDDDEPQTTMTTSTAPTTQETEIGTTDTLGNDITNPDISNSNTPDPSEENSSEVDSAPSISGTNSPPSEQIDLETPQDDGAPTHTDILPESSPSTDPLIDDTSVPDPLLSGTNLELQTDPLLGDSLASSPPSSPRSAVSSSPRGQVKSSEDHQFQTQSPPQSPRHTKQLQSATPLKERFSILINFFKLILRLSPSKDIQDAICEQYALISSSEEGRNLIVENGAIPVLMTLLLSEDQNVLRSTAEAIVNITSQNPTAKSIVISEGFVTLALRHLQSGDDILISTLLKVLKNVMDTKEHRDSIASAGMIPALLHLISPPNIFGSVMKPSILAAAVSALWNLSKSPEVLKKLVTSDLPEKLKHLLKVSKNDAVVQKVAGCLSILSTDPSIVSNYGPLIIPDLCRLLSVSTEVATIKYLLALLINLSNDPLSLSKMRSQNIELLMETLSGQSDHPQIIKFVNILISRIQ